MYLILLSTLGSVLSSASNFDWRRATQYRYPISCLTPRTFLENSAAVVQFELAKETWQGYLKWTHVLTGRRNRSSWIRGFMSNTTRNLELTPSLVIGFPSPSSPLANVLADS